MLIDFSVFSKSCCAAPGRPQEVCVLQVAAYQFNIELGHVASNLRKATASVKKAAARGADLVVLPEMWCSGFTFRGLDRLAAEAAEAIEQIAKTAGEYETAVIGSALEIDGDRAFNTAHVIDSDGKIVGSYRKIHLFPPTYEDYLFEEGDSTLVTDTRVGRIGVAVCYDLRFPELVRRLALDGAEILTVPAQWPRPRDEHWRVLLRARAIENQLFVIGANRVGQEGDAEFPGSSAILNPWGDVLAESGDREALISAEIRLEEISETRRRIPVHQGRRAGIYGKF